MTDVRSTNNLHPWEHSLTSRSGVYGVSSSPRWIRNKLMLKRNNRLREKVLVNYIVTNALPRVKLEPSNYVLHLAEQRGA